MDRPPTFIHELALCESDQVGPGTRVWAFAHVMKGAVVGRDCNISDHVYIESGAVVGDRCAIKNNVMVWERVVIEDDVFVGPNAVLTNDRYPRAAGVRNGMELLPTRIRKGATIGANATIVCGVTIGRAAFVGAGAVVLQDVPDHGLVVGNPARTLGWVCSCGQRLYRPLRCDSCGAEFERKPDGGLVAGRGPHPAHLIRIGDVQSGPRRSPPRTGKGTVIPGATGAGTIARSVFRAVRLPNRTASSATSAPPRVHTGA